MKLWTFYICEPLRCYLPCMCVLQDETQTNGSLLSQLLMLLLSVDSSLHYRASRLLQIVCSAYRCFHDFDLIKLIIS